jgi:hypothetical protein
MTEAQETAAKTDLATRAVMYLRVSDRSQVERDDTEEGYSIPA